MTAKNNSLSFIILFVLLIPAMVGAVELNCENEVEINCGDNKCEVSKEFTPMQITYTTKKIRICAYSGCWVGKPITQTSGTHLHVSAHKMKWEGVGTNPTDALLSIDLKGKIGVLSVSNFAVPIMCNKQPK